jgi:hypothetical protein
MKCAFDGDDFGAACHLERHSQRVLVSLSARVHKKNAVEVITCEAGESSGGAHPHIHGDRIALEAAGIGLSSERVRPAWVLVAERSDSVTAVKIENTAPISRMEPNAFRIDNFDGVLRKNRSEMIDRTHE